MSWESTIWELSYSVTLYCLLCMVELLRGGEVGRVVSKVGEAREAFWILSLKAVPPY